MRFSAFKVSDQAFEEVPVARGWRLSCSCDLADNVCNVKSCGVCEVPELSNSLFILFFDVISGVFILFLYACVNAIWVGGFCCSGVVKVELVETFFDSMRLGHMNDFGGPLDLPVKILGSFSFFGYIVFFCKFFA